MVAAGADAQTQKALLGTKTARLMKSARVGKSKLVGSRQPMLGKLDQTSLGKWADDRQSIQDERYARRVQANDPTTGSPDDSASG